jgi:hypothetical protein
VRIVPEPPQGLHPVDPREWMRMWARVIGPASLKNVGAWCAYFADYRTGAEIRPGIPLLMKVCGGMGNKTVGDSLRQMRDWGVLWRYAEASKNGVKGNSDIHRLTFPDDISAIPMLGPDWGEPVENLLTTCRHDTWSTLDHLFPRQVPTPNHLSSRQPTLTKYNPYGVALPIPIYRASVSGGSAGSAPATRPKSGIGISQWQCQATASAAGGRATSPPSAVNSARRRTGPSTGGG